MTTRPCKVVVDELIEAMIARPETFSCDEYTLRDGKSGIEFWVANGPFIVPTFAAIQDGTRWPALPRRSACPASRDGHTIR